LNSEPINEFNLRLWRQNLFRQIVEDLSPPSEHLMEPYNVDLQMRESLFIVHDVLGRRRCIGEIVEHCDTVGFRPDANFARACDVPVFGIDIDGSVKRDLNRIALVYNP
jgi:hypothetical protein